MLGTDQIGAVDGEEWITLAHVLVGRVGLPAADAYVLDGVQEEVRLDAVLAVVEVGVASSAREKLLVPAALDDPAVFQDEVDINTNPKIGSMWMVKGQQAEVKTPGNNEKRYLSGSLPWRTGQVFLTEGKPKQGRNTALFLAHLDDLRSRLPRYRKIHVICDQATCHTSEAVAIYLWEQRDRIALHLLPAYSPDGNPIERVWWHLHEEITRNHRCQTMKELLDLTFAWFRSKNPFQVEGSVYEVKEAA